ncbi:unnamed protein product [Rhizoctonia solani]|uniref:Enoyl reductase (ER) domain-containing protein n=1 Tax=Rhizoctonia solani TaxID=456999 RepID=A0A8H3ACU1_9AGAM|nr:unnamed protein product [Rhizoctonia solani]
MAPIQNARLVFNKVPQDFPVPGETTVYDTSETIDLDNVALNGGILAKTLYLSIDPYFRGRMRDEGKKSYSNAFPLGKPISGFSVSCVLRSEKEGVKEGDNIYVYETPFQEYNVLSAKHPVMVIDNKENIPLSVYVGILGMPGKTAYYALDVIGQPKKGETIYVSTGAGPVGATVSQLCKSLGLKVIASAGSDDKVEFLKSIGVDVAFNYKKDKISDVLEKEGPIDIYWDNVGGESLEAALEACNDHARVICCGAISAYNGTPKPIKNWTYFLTKRLTVRGFIVGELEAQVGNPKVFYEKMVPLVANGQIKWNEHVFEGLDKAGDAILAVQKGDNTAKTVVKVADA